MNTTPEIASRVEQVALAASAQDALYPPAEKIPTIVVDNFPALGRLAALRFLEWVQAHPGGVISLPTGKTPEHFIHWVTRLLQTWDEAETRALLEASGVDPATRPDMKSLRFVQIDEFYPIQPWQKNSFCYYIKEFYLKGLGLDPARALLIDCSEIGLEAGESLETVWPQNTVDLSLRYRQAADELEAKQQRTLTRIDAWCQTYEDRIRGLGGIGFFLGGIGPDGHIGFNVRGSDHHSTTRLTPTNYETQAAAAQDLGGIEISRQRLVITIGLGTITANPDCVALVIAAGEAKAQVVADAIQQEKHVLYPATALQRLRGARFFITAGAAKRLEARRLRRLETAPALSEEALETLLMDLAAKQPGSLGDLTPEAVQMDPGGKLLCAKAGRPLPGLIEAVQARLAERIARGAEPVRNTRFFHTEPHHDDIMLGYLPAIVRHTRDPSNDHHFACLTSGFTAVTNLYLRRQLVQLQACLDSADFQALAAEGYFDPQDAHGRQRDVWQYLDGVAAKSAEMMAEGEARRLLRDLVEIYDEQEHASLRNRIKEIVHYLDTEYPGKKDPEYIQKLKGMRREWEAECLWGYFGWQCSHVMHLRLGFYTGDIFVEEPTRERDVPPILAALETVQPDVITVALDPEGSGPDTHYKVLQAVAEALRLYEERSGRSDLRVWGYRNVWYRFHPAEANLYIPVSLNMLTIMENAFLSCFGSQRAASFPSYEHDGPFCELAQRTQVEQYEQLKACLGREWFHEHASAMIRATRGFVFLREMDLDEFYARTRDLRRATESQ